MKACVDVHYQENSAHAALLLFQNWSDAAPSEEMVCQIPVASPYLSGEFYRRELEPILAVLDQVSSIPDTLIIDGYCDLSPNGRPGLGRHLHSALPTPPVIIGVAKSPFPEASHARSIHRGQSERPLFVTAIGADPDQAAQWIVDMHGEFRIPSLLKRVDRLARTSRPQEDTV